MRRQAIADVRRIVDAVGRGAGHIIVLNDYQVANLRAAIHATGYASIYKDSPLSVLNNGDWLGELMHLLPHVEYKPNATPAELAERARAWRV